MYWYLANLPQMPGSDTEATLRLSESNDVLLQKSTDSYQQVIKDPALANQSESINQAHLGLEAIAENHRDWTAAQKELHAVIDDSNSVPVLVDLAKTKLDALPALEQPVYVLPPSGVATSQPATAPTVSLPFGPALPSTKLTTKPSTTP